MKQSTYLIAFLSVIAIFLASCDGTKALNQTMPPPFSSRAFKRTRAIQPSISGSIERCGSWENPHPSAQRCSNAFPIKTACPLRLFVRWSMTCVRTTGTKKPMRYWRSIFCLAKKGKSHSNRRGRPSNSRERLADKRFTALTPAA